MQSYIELMEFTKSLINWYLQNKRELPWRATNDPYLVWLSEIMLQQTRVAQGLAYFLKFKETFPTVHDLANAEEDLVLKMWQGLGYYSRARNLHQTAKQISNELNGQFPKSYKELLKLKGVGDYTASAIASICFNQPEAVVDGNVFRVLARYFGIKTPTNTTKGKKEFKELAQSLLAINQPGIYNQAIMDFGAMQCKPQNPDCTMCPLSNSCVALQKKIVKELPIKEKKQKIKNRYFHYLYIVTKDKKTILQQRQQKGIWQGLYQFPLVELSSKDDQNIINHDDFKKWVPERSKIMLINSEPIIHKLSHQHLYTHFWKISVDTHLKANVAINQLNKYAVPVLIANFIEDIAAL